MKVNRFFGLLLVCSIGSLTLSAQHPNVMISNSGYPTEPTIVVNPKNPNQVMAGAVLDHYYYSLDGGLSWQGGLLSSDYGVYGDPCVVVDTAGTFYYFHLSNPPAGNWIDRIVCQKASLPNPSWSAGTYMGLNGLKAQDKEWACVNPQNNHIYACWTQFDNYGSSDPLDSSIIRFSRSTDNGLTWSTPVRLSRRAGDCVDEDNTVEGAVPAMGPNGEIYTSWAGPLGIMFDRSTDDGLTWLYQDIFVSVIPGGWDFAVPGIYRCNGMPVTCCDLSNGPYRGNIYINWSDQRNGPGDTDVWFVKSTDGGNTWCAPKRVNDDPPGKQQFFTWMDVDPVTGYIWFVFYDRRNYTGIETDVYMAVSKDGGETFLNFKVSEMPFIPNASIFFGDYTDVSAYNNVVRPVWTRLNSGELGIWTAIVDPTFVGTDNQVQPPFSLEQNYPNPFRESTFFAFKLKRSSVVTLEIHDLNGRKAAVMIDGKQLEAGKYVESFDNSKYHLPSGIYYFTLLYKNQLQKRQMMLVR